MGDNQEHRKMRKGLRRVQGKRWLTTTIVSITESIHHLWTNRVHTHTHTHTYTHTHTHTHIYIYIYIWLSSWKMQSVIRFQILDESLVQYWTFFTINQIKASRTEIKLPNEINFTPKLKTNKITNKKPTKNGIFLKMINWSDWKHLGAEPRASSISTGL